MRLIVAATKINSGKKGRRRNLLFVREAPTPIKETSIN